MVQICSTIQFPALETEKLRYYSFVQSPVWFNIFNFSCWWNLFGEVLLMDSIDFLHSYGMKCELFQIARIRVTFVPRCNNTDLLFIITGRCMHKGSCEDIKDNINSPGSSWKVEKWKFNLISECNWLHLYYPWTRSALSGVFKYAVTVADDINENKFYLISESHQSTHN